MIGIIKVLILSLVEGITEFLPVSSTGHLILVNQFVQLKPKEFSNAFNVIIQLGAIFAVIVVYFEKLYPIKKRVVKNKRNIKKTIKYIDKNTIKLYKRIIAGFLPAAVLGFLFDDFIDSHLFSVGVVATMLFVWGIIIIAVEKKNKKKKYFKYDSLEDLPLKVALYIGFFQALAMIPGTSRSAATIMGAMILGLNRKTACEFSFFLAIPTMLGATALKLIKGLGNFSLYEHFLILTGMILSFIVAYIVIRKFLEYVKRHDFVVFGIYRIILSLLIIMYFGFLKF